MEFNSSDFQSSSVKNISFLEGGTFNSNILDSFSESSDGFNSITDSDLENLLFLREWDFIFYLQEGFLDSLSRGSVVSS